MPKPPFKSAASKGGRSRPSVRKGMAKASAKKPGPPKR
jgi:hypothetical protein